jgi:putative alpha-1,2-mannosidase
MKTRNSSDSFSIIPQGRGRLPQVGIAGTKLFILPLALALAVGRTDGQTAPGADYTSYVNLVQDSNGQNRIHKTALLRYPCGRIGLWTIDHGEFADCVSRGLRLYPCVDTVVPKGNTNDWRKTISGTPSQVDITYRSDVPAKGSSVQLTVTPHVSVYRYHLAAATNYQAIVLMAGDSHVTNLRWDSSTVAMVDDKTVEVTVRNTHSSKAVYYYIRFNVPAQGQGVMEAETVTEGARAITGDKVCGYLKFTASDVTAAVAVSHTSLAQARAYLEEEFSDMNFDAATARLKTAWNKKLARVEARGPELALRQLYTALYTVYVNVIDATDNPYYHGSKPLLTIASSDYWQAMTLYMRCDWDMSRGVYSLVALIDPELFAQLLNAYQAQYDRDGKFLPNWDPFWASGFRESLYLANFTTLAYQEGIAGVDYARLKDSLVDHVQKHYQTPFFTSGFVPAESSDASPASRTLEYCTQLQGLAILGRALGDTAAYEKYYHYRTNYALLYDAPNQQFRVKQANGEWGPAGKKFFEGNGVDYGFCAPHDPYGLLNLYGASNAVAKIERYMRHRADFNDYQLIYEFLPMFADRADITQDLVRTAHVPKFNSLIMAEGFWPGPRGCYYTDNAGPLACCLLGLYWIPTSGGTWLITTPSLERVTIHGKTDLTIQSVNLSTNNNYISSIQLNGAAFPSLLISAKALAGKNQILTVGLGCNPVKLAPLYLSSTDGEVLSAALEGHNQLSFAIEPLAASCTAQVYSEKPPKTITRNGKSFASWIYDSTSQLATLQHMAEGKYQVIVGD